MCANLENYTKVRAVSKALHLSHETFNRRFQPREESSQPLSHYGKKTGMFKKRLDKEENDNWRERENSIFLQYQTR